MKTITAVKFNFLIAVLTLTALFFFYINAFAGTDLENVNTASQQLIEINKKLDAAQKRDEKILAQQEKILSEVIKSRKWAYNN